jgi:hypothetical protein
MESPGIGADNVGDQRPAMRSRLLPLGWLTLAQRRRACMPERNLDRSLYVREAMVWQWDDVCSTIQPPHLLSIKVSLCACIPPSHVGA